MLLKVSQTVKNIWWTSAVNEWEAWNIIYFREFCFIWWNTFIYSFVGHTSVWIVCRHNESSGDNERWLECSWWWKASLRQKEFAVNDRCVAPKLHMVVLPSGKTTGQRVHQKLPFRHNLKDETSAKLRGAEQNNNRTNLFQGNWHVSNFMILYLHCSQILTAD